MNRLHHSARLLPLLRRTTHNASSSSCSYSTFVARRERSDEPTLEEKLMMARPTRRSQQRTKPESPSFYTARASYYDQIYQLEDAVSAVRGLLKTLSLLPLPTFARDILPQLPFVWRTKDEMTRIFETSLTTSRYRKVIALLNQLGEYQRISVAAGLRDLDIKVPGVGTLQEQLTDLDALIGLFESDNKDIVLARGVKRPVKFDEYGRSYTVGRRKTSTARVWMIRTKTYMQKLESPLVLQAPGESEPLPQTAEALATLQVGSPQEAVGPPQPTPTNNAHEWILDSIEWNSQLERPPPPPPPPSSSPPPPPQPKVQLPEIPIIPSEILINNTPLSRYFPLPADRERVVRPFTVSGLLGAYHVFAIVRGGGMSGQSGAVALAVAKGLVAQEKMWGLSGEGEQVEAVLKKGTLLRRDPRMVERKKPGYAKARKKYAWVKR